jgi:hypothetical protein
MGRRGFRKPKGPKRVSYRLIERDTVAGKPIYAMLDSIVATHHPDIRLARIAVAFNRTWKPDVDGNVKLGQCKKASDLDRELADFDFVVVVQERFWTDPLTTDEKRRALLDHELCHAAVKLDPRTLEPVEDERGRKIYRLVKHDIEEFSAVVERHGIWKKNLEVFAAALYRSKQGTLPLEPPGAGPNVTQTAQVLGKVAELAGEVKPSEPHAFLAVGGGGLQAQMCKHCGSGKDDPVHGPRPEASAAAAAPEEARGNGNGKGHGPVARAKARSKPAAARNGKAARP